ADGATAGRLVRSPSQAGRVPRWGECDSSCWRRSSAAIPPIPAVESPGRRNWRAIAHAERKEATKPAVPIKSSPGIKSAMQVARGEFLSDGCLIPSPLLGREGQSEGPSVERTQTFNIQHPTFNIQVWTLTLHVGCLTAPTFCPNPPSTGERG